MDIMTIGYSPVLGGKIMLEFPVTYWEDLFQNQFHKHDNLSQTFVILYSAKKR